jgi:hypothetical protein
LHRENRIVKREKAGKNTLEFSMESLSKRGRRRHILVREVCLDNRPESAVENIRRTIGTAYPVAGMGRADLVAGYHSHLTKLPNRNSEQDPLFEW